VKADDLPEFDPADILTDEVTVIAYLSMAAKGNDLALLQNALSDVARSTVGMSALACMSNVARENLCDALSEHGNLSLGTVMKFLDALGLSMTFKPRDEAIRTKGPLSRPTDDEDAAIQRGIDADPDNPEWTAEDFAKARPFSELATKKQKPPPDRSG
jgi:probable addiction module antidote protein